MENLISVQKISKFEQAELVALACQGDKKAKDRLIMSCSGLIKKIIMKYVNENTWCYSRLNLIYEDLLNSGILGILYAFEKFDVSHDTAFSSYAFFWIDAFIRKQFNAIQKERYSQSLDMLSNELDTNVTSEKNEELFDTALRKILCQQLLATIETLEREIVILFFGIDCRRHTLSEIARKYGFSTSYAGKVKEKALQKMRNNYYCYALKYA